MPCLDGSELLPMSPSERGRSSFVPNKVRPCSSSRTYGKSLDSSSMPIFAILQVGARMLKVSVTVNHTPLTESDATTPKVFWCVCIDVV